MQSPGSHDEDVCHPASPRVVTRLTTTAVDRIIVLDLGFLTARYRCVWSGKLTVMRFRNTL